MIIEIIIAFVTISVILGLYSLYLQWAAGSYDFYTMDPTYKGTWQEYVVSTMNGSFPKPSQSAIDSYGYINFWISYYTIRTGIGDFISPPPPSS